jgi:hypothetical protein
MQRSNYIVGKSAGGTMWTLVDTRNGNSATFHDEVTVKILQLALNSWDQGSAQIPHVPRERAPGFKLWDDAP